MIYQGKVPPEKLSIGQRWIIKGTWNLHQLVEIVHTTDFEYHVKVLFNFNDFMRNYSDTFTFKNKDFYYEYLEGQDKP